MPSRRTAPWPLSGRKKGPRRKTQPLINSEGRSKAALGFTGCNLPSGLQLLLFPPHCRDGLEGRAIARTANVTSTPPLALTAPSGAYRVSRESRLQATSLPGTSSFPLGQTSARRIQPLCHPETEGLEPCIQVPVPFADAATGASPIALGCRPMPGTLCISNRLISSVFFPVNHGQPAAHPLAQECHCAACRQYGPTPR